MWIKIKKNNYNFFLCICLIVNLNEVHMFFLKSFSRVALLVLLVSLLCSWRVFGIFLNCKWRIVLYFSILFAFRDFGWQQRYARFCGRIVVLSILSLLLYPFLWAWTVIGTLWFTRARDCVSSSSHVFLEWPLLLILFVFTYQKREKRWM